MDNRHREAAITAVNQGMGPRALNKSFDQELSPKADTQSLNQEL